MKYFLFASLILTPSLARAGQAPSYGRVYVEAAPEFCRTPSDGNTPCPDTTCWQLADKPQGTPGEVLTFRALPPNACGASANASTTDNGKTISVRTMMISWGNSFINSGPGSIWFASNYVRYSCYDQPTLCGRGYLWVFTLVRGQ